MPALRPNKVSHLLQNIVLHYFDMTIATISPTTWMLVALALLLAVAGVACRRSARVETRETPEPATNSYPHFVFAKVMDPVMPIDRGTKYEDPLFETLEVRSLGEVTGGGSQLNKENKIEWVGIDIQLADLDGALELVRQRLRELGAPAGSVLEFERDGKQVTVPIH